MNILVSAPYMHREKEKCQALLKAYGFENVEWANVAERLSEDELLQVIDRFDGVICGDDRFTATVFDKATRLKAVVKWGTGVDSIDESAAKSAGIFVGRTLDAFTDPVADSTLGFILSLVRGVHRHHSEMKKQNWVKFQCKSMKENTLGIIGMGRIGTAVTQRAKSFGSKVIFCDVKKIQSEWAKQVSFEELLNQAHIISLHCDLNSSSYQILNNQAFSKMKQMPFLINTARGPLIDEQALVEALERKTLSGAGLDVFEEEPLPKESKLRTFENVILSPHATNSSPKRWDHVHRNSVRILKEALNV